MTPDNSPSAVAAGAMNRLCRGAVHTTAWSLLLFEVALLHHALVRGAQRAYNQRSLTR
jgi:hypothetical protein